MRRLIALFLANLVLLVVVARSATISQAAPNNAARFGYYWRSNTLPYDTELSYFFDVAVYPDGVFADCQQHSWAAVTAQNKHITYGGVPYPRAQSIIEDAIQTNSGAPKPSNTTKR